MSHTLVNKATKDDYDAIGGPLLKELADRSKMSFDESSAIQGYLLKRLEKNSPQIKLKVLNCIRYICINGRDGFRRSLQRNDTLIRACTHFRAPTDPLRGDTPAEKVRKAAKDAIAAIYSDGQR